MRILNILHHPIFGGPANGIARTSRYLSNMGVELLVITPKEPGNINSRLREHGVATHSISLQRIRSTRNLVTQGKFFASLAYDIRNIRSVIRDFHPDVVQVNGMENPHGAIAGLQENVAVVGQILGPGMPMPLRLAVGFWTKQFTNVAMIPGLGLSKYFPGISKMGARLVPFIPPVDVDEFDPEAINISTLKHDLGIEKSSPVIGTLGNINPAKGYDTLLRAAHLVLRKHPNAKFIITGEVTHSQLKLFTKLKLIMTGLGLSLDNHVFFIQECSNPVQMLNSIDIYVQTSVAEGISTALLEAMSMGKPVIATRVGSTTEVVEDNFNGILVDPDNPTQMANQIIELINSKERRALLGQNGREFILEKGTAKQCAETHYNAYKLAISHSNNIETFK